MKSLGAGTKFAIGAAIVAGIAILLSPKSASAATAPAPPPPGGGGSGGGGSTLNPGDQYVNPQNPGGDQSIVGPGQGTVTTADSGPFSDT